MLVAAPTGSGKTLVGEFAVHLALQTGRKCFYTTPIKALSNQKFHDLVDRYGADKVGLLTGDNTINGEAPVVVMTTEVLRNMLYAGSRTLLGLGFVVMDEVHYLADRARGAVWEEVIIHLPESVALVSLSATVSNAEEFGEWLQTVRGDTTTIVEERRPVPLYQHVMVGKRLLDLFASSDIDAAAGLRQGGCARSTTSWSGSRATTGPAAAIRDRRTPKDRRGRGNGRATGAAGRQRPPRLDPEPGRRGRPARPRRPAARRSSSSSAGSAATRPSSSACTANLRLTSPEERDEIHDYVEQALRHLPADDLHVLGYHDFLDAPDPRRGSAPRGDAAGLQGGRRGAVHPRPGEGRVRDRDAGAGHQHAGAHGRHREARQVERRDPRRHHAGGVHPARPVVPDAAASTSRATASCCGSRA